MFYTDTNFKTKKQLREAVLSGKSVRVFAPGLGNPPVNGTTAVGGPQYPQPHVWYAQVTLVDGIIVNVK
jgi:hypothetical protein